MIIGEQFHWLLECLLPNLLPEIPIKNVKVEETENLYNTYK